MLFKSNAGLSRHLILSCCLVYPLSIQAQMPYNTAPAPVMPNYSMPQMPMPDHQMMHDQMHSGKDHQMNHEKMLADPDHRKMHEQMMADPEHRKIHDKMHPKQGFDGMNQPMPMMPNFPTPQELSRLTPPEPMTEEKIKARFAKRKALMTEAMERDRKAAEKYARDFARYQKHQADTLAEIMSKAEQRRKQRLKMLDEQEQRALEKFKQYAAPKLMPQGKPSDATAAQK